MLDNARLRERLSAITRARRFAREEGGSGRVAEEPGSPSPRASLEGETRTGVEAFLPGGEWRDARGAVFVHERLRSEVEKPKPHWGRLGEPPETEPDLQAL